MLKKLFYQNQPLKDFLDKSKYDLLIIESITWQVDSNDQCQPYVTARLAVSFPKADFGLSPDLSVVYKKLNFQERLNFLKCN